MLTETQFSETPTPTQRDTTPTGTLSPNDNDNIDLICDKSKSLVDAIFASNFNLTYDYNNNWFYLDEKLRIKNDSNYNFSNDTVYDCSLIQRYCATKLWTISQYPPEDINVISKIKY